MTQDRRFELERRWIGLESEILHECLTEPAGGPQRSSLRAGAVMGEHQLPPDSLLVGLLADQRLELGHDQRVPPGGQIGVDALGDRVKTRRSQPHRLGGHKRDDFEVCEGRPLPQGERLGEQLACDVLVTVAGGPSSQAIRSGRRRPAGARWRGGSRRRRLEQGRRRPSDRRSR